MGILLILSSLLVHQGESMIVKLYGKKHGKGGLFFNAIICFCALLYTTITELFQTEYLFYFPKELLGYGIVSGLFYATGFYATYLAFQFGSFGMTKLLSSFGTIIPIVYGILFLKEPATLFTYISVLLILFSVFLMNYQKSAPAATSRPSAKWGICVALTILANAGIAILAKSQQLRFGTKCSSEFLILSYFIAVVSLLTLGIIYERANLKNVVKKGVLYGFFAGILNGGNNLLIILTYLYVPLSVVSPVKTALNLAISFFISVLFYRETFTKRQLASVVIGILAVVLINVS